MQASIRHSPANEQRRNPLANPLAATTAAFVERRRDQALASQLKRAFARARSGLFLGRLRRMGKTSFLFLGTGAHRARVRELTIKGNQAVGDLFVAEAHLAGDDPVTHD